MLKPGDTIRCPITGERLRPPLEQYSNRQARRSFQGGELRPRSGTPFPSGQFAPERDLGLELLRRDVEAQLIEAADTATVEVDRFGNRLLALPDDEAEPESARAVQDHQAFLDVPHRGPQPDRPGRDGGRRLLAPVDVEIQMAATRSVVHPLDS